MPLRPPTHDLLVRAARGEATERTPIWLMRQAGRSDPAYLRYREEHPAPLEALFRSPEHAANISLLPERFGVDGIIFYQDILTLLTPMGAHFVFNPGPSLQAPIDTVAALDALHTFDVERELAFVGETFDRIDAQLAGRLPVLGFAGAPLTLAAFVLQGGSFGHTADRFQAFLKNEHAALHRFLEKCTEATIAYLRYQTRCGVVAVQLFESVAYLLSPQQYRDFALPYQQQIFRALKGEVITIQFAREWNDLASLQAAGADIVSLPSTISVREARAALGPRQVLQGNLDNHLLAHGPWEEVEASARRILAEGAHTAHIFNLSHGLLRETPFERIERLVRIVRGEADQQG